METMIEMVACGIVATGIGSLVMVPVLGVWSLVEKFDKNNKFKNWLLALA